MTTRSLGDFLNLCACEGRQRSTAKVWRRRWVQSNRLPWHPRHRNGEVLSAYHDALWWCAAL